MQAETSLSHTHTREHTHTYTSSAGSILARPAAQISYYQPLQISIVRCFPLIIVAKFVALPDGFTLQKQRGAEIMRNMCVFECISLQ